MPKIEHVWIPKKEIMMVGTQGAWSGASLKELKFFECKRCKIRVMKKDATPHKDCDDCLAAFVINEGEHI